MNPFMSIDGEERGRSEPKKSNNFEPFFSDSTLTFLTSENTFRLPILPSRRIVFLCLPQIFLCLPLIFLCLPLIFPGCASKSPILKGKWRKKGGAEAPPISLYKYNTFRRQKQEVLKPKKGVGCGKFLEAVCHNSQSASLLSDSGLVMYFSTLPAPSSSAPCVLAILTHLRGWSQNVHFDTPSQQTTHLLPSRDSCSKTKCKVRVQSSVQGSCAGSLRCFV